MRERRFLKRCNTNNVNELGIKKTKLYNQCKYDSCQTWENRYSPYVDCTVDTSGDGGKLMENLLQKYQTESDWHGQNSVWGNEKSTDLVS